MEMIKPGHYQLSRDVANPKPDRRSKDWDKLSVWPAGTKVYVRECTRELGDMKVTVNTIEFVDSRWPSLHEIAPHTTEQYEAIRPALVPVEETYKRLLHRLQVRDTYWVLKQLVVMGKLTHADIEAAKEAEDVADQQPVTPSDND